MPGIQFSAAQSLCCSFVGENVDSLDSLPLDDAANPKVQRLGGVKKGFQIVVFSNISPQSGVELLLPLGRGVLWVWVCGGGEIVRFASATNSRI